MYFVAKNIVCKCSELLNLKSDWKMKIDLNLSFKKSKNFVLLA